MKLFELLGVITVNNQDANKKIDDTQKRTKALHDALLSGLETAGKWAIKFASSAATAAESTKAALTKIVTENTAAMNTIDKASQRLGLTKKSYQEWSYVLQQSGTSIDRMESGMMALAKRMKEVQDGNVNTKTMFDTLGVAATDNEGNLRDFGMVFEELIAAMTVTKGDKMTTADFFFGGSGQQLQYLLDTSYDDIVALKQEANDLGIILTDEQIAAAAEFVNTTNTLKTAYGSLGADITSSLIPALQQFYDFLIEKFPTIKTEFVDGFLPALKDVVSGVLGIIQALLDPDGEMNLDESINKIVMGLVSIASRLAQHVPTLVDGLVMLFSALLPYVDDLVAAALPLVTALIKGIVDSLPDILSAVGDNAGDIASVFLGLLGLGTGKFLFKKGISKGKSAISKWAKNLLKPGETPTTDAPAPATDTAKGGALHKAWEAMKSFGQKAAEVGKLAGAKVADVASAALPYALPAAGVATVLYVNEDAKRHEDERYERWNEGGHYAALYDEEYDPRLTQLKRDLLEYFYNAVTIDGVSPEQARTDFFSEYFEFNPETGRYNERKVNATADILREYQDKGWFNYSNFDPGFFSGDQYMYDAYINALGELFERIYTENKDNPNYHPFSMDDWDESYGEMMKVINDSGSLVPRITAGDISPLITMLASLSEKLDTVINQQAQGKTIVLNTGALVGGIGGAIDKHLGNTVLNKARGMA